MFQAGDLLVYGTTGVCRVLSIDRRQERVGSTRQERLYYQLKPIYQGGLIYTPVDNDKVSMRPIISRQEAEDLISEIPTLHPAACRASTTQALTQQYQASLRQHNCRSLVELDKLSGIETRMDVTITEVSLTLMRIRDKGSSQGTIVPVWDFWGSWSWYAPGTDTSEVMQNGVSCRQPMLTLNAVDGTVVSRLFGY